MNLVVRRKEFTMQLGRISIGALILAMASWLHQEPLSSKDDAEKEKPKIGVVVFEKGADDERHSRITDHLHFCVFEDGKNDAVYVATRWGGWYNGQFELRHDSKVVVNVKVPDLIYGGVMIPIGDVLDEIPKNNGGMGGPLLYITNVRGILK